jgi:hypothetical protein
VEAGERRLVSTHPATSRSSLFQPEIFQPEILRSCREPGGHQHAEFQGGKGSQYTSGW